MVLAFNSQLKDKFEGTKIVIRSVSQKQRDNTMVKKKNGIKLNNCPQNTTLKIKKIE